MYALKIVTTTLIALLMIVLTVATIIGKDKKIAILVILLGVIQAMSVFCMWG
jgi:hypothetical protein